MNNNINIGLLGTVINNSNMGCVALTYSVIILLEEISNKIKTEFNYFIFENIPDKSKTDLLEKNLNITPGKIKTFPVSFFYRNISKLHHFISCIDMNKAINNCDIFLDITEGDSFTDIYGSKRFLNTVNIKQRIIKKQKKLILGPQTYGPFQNKENLDIAIKIIKEADCVISRDELSALYINQFTSKNIVIGTDLAFLLPYNKTKYKKNTGKIKIGINISSLLVKNKTDSSDVCFKLKTDYELYLKRVLDFFDKSNIYDVYVIPHVGDDGGNLYRKIYKNFIYIDRFESPIEAKSIISQMDIFIGARMHATIAAISSGVATIPNAYSRKFKGVFDNIGYPYCVDLENLTTDVSVKMTIDMINNFKELSNKAKLIKSSVNKKLAIITDSIYREIYKNL